MRGGWPCNERSVEFQWRFGYCFTPRRSLVAADLRCQAADAANLSPFARAFRSNSPRFFLTFGLRAGRMLPFCVSAIDAGVVISSNLPIHLEVHTRPVFNPPPRTDWQGRADWCGGLPPGQHQCRERDADRCWVLGGDGSAGEVCAWSERVMGVLVPCWLAVSWNGRRL